MRWVIAAVVLLLLIGPTLLRAVVKKRVQRAVVGRLPDRIHLIPGEPAWRDGGRVASIQTELAALGFAWVGDFRIPEMPHVGLRLLLRVDEGVYANIHEMPRVSAPWLELVTPYRDGRRARVTTMSPTGMKTPPWLVKDVHAPGATPRDALRLLAERPHDGIAMLAPETLPRLWEDEYARIAAWRKGNS